MWPLPWPGCTLARDTPIIEPLIVTVFVKIIIPVIVMMTNDDDDVINSGLLTILLKDIGNSVLLWYC